MALQIAALFGLSGIGTLISRWTHMPVPGSIWGLVILFLLLQFRIVKIHWIAKGGDWLIREMLLFFIPSSVGVMSYGSLLLHEGLQIVLTIVASTAIVMLTTGAIAERMWKWRQRRLATTAIANEEERTLC